MLTRLNFGTPLQNPQTGGSSAAVYFVNGLFQLSSSAARVQTHISGPGPKDPLPIDFSSVFDLQARGIEKLWCFDLRLL